MIFQKMRVNRKKAYLFPPERVFFEPGRKNTGTQNPTRKLPTSVFPILSRINSSGGYGG
jgi:hypothetical protein